MLEEWQRDRLNTEWILANAFREIINIAGRKPEKATFRQALRLAEKMAPGVFSPNKRILHGVMESVEARRYREKAEAESNLSAKHVSTFDYVNQEIQKITRQIEANPDGGLLRGELETLLRVREEVRPKKYTESPLIWRDAACSEMDLPVSGQGKGYTEFHVDIRRRLRIRVLHTEPAESKVGADLIYEHIDLKATTVRFALLQYKRWDGKSLHRDPRMVKPDKQDEGGYL